ncbi:MAG TPA: hypothetical protein VNC39_04395 [Acidocella sp.]|jgi:hypothetical protein|uniref:hypothetical protein n=1 Tax=Acidocella sp. TaxID=50710 RepID=UPI002C0D6EF7|nr:hypothetical protein [Acidocella sp.]HVE21192.1 hypothetical protein [Acidocella sp.]
MSLRPRDRICFWVALASEAGVLVLMACLGLGALLHRQDLFLAGPVFALLIVGIGLLGAGQEHA